jgi:hypothetical protein
MQRLGDKFAAMSSGTGKGSGKAKTQTKGAGKGATAGQRNTSICGCCGVAGHPKRDCFHKLKSCNKCGRQGHLAQVCRSEAAAPSTAPKDRVPGVGQQTFLEATLRLPWMCLTCNVLVNGDNKTCQQVGCKSKKPILAATVVLPEQTFLSKKFTRKDTVPNTSSDETVTEEEHKTKVLAARNILEMAKKSGMETLWNRSDPVARKRTRVQKWTAPARSST